MIGIVIVSHSAKLAEGVVELAREMGGNDLLMQGVGGIDSPSQHLGTDPLMILEAIEKVYSAEGVLVLMDLGSALMSAEMAIEMLPPQKASAVRLCDAPLVEGAIAAAVQARLGSPIEQVIQEAKGALIAKETHLGDNTTLVEDAEKQLPTQQEPTGQKYELLIKVDNPLGLHARPAAHFVQTAGSFSGAEIYVQNQTTGRGPVSAKSINGVTTLGVQQGHEILITASGSQAQAALAALQILADNNFGDGEYVQPSIPLDMETPRTVSVSDSGFPLEGLPVSPGIAIGPAKLFKPEIPDIPDQHAENPQEEWDALLDSIEKTRAQIRADFEIATRRTDNYTAAIFEAHLLFLDDEALRSPARESIFNDKKNAAAAWMHAVEQVAAQYRSLDDSYLQTRAKDVEDVGQQVLINLLGMETIIPAFDEPGILVASNLTPAETTHLDPSKVRGILTAFGGPTSHAAILARSLGIPAVAGLGEGILNLPVDALLVMDGEKGKVWIRPEAEFVAEYTNLAQVAEEAKAQALSESREPAITIDGHRVEIAANIRSAKEAQNAVASGAEGVGLFRTEFLFLDRENPPDEEEQYATYQAAAAALAGRSLIIRTLDAGGDKPIPYLNLEREANPFLGWRAIRLCLEHPDLFKTQLRAIIRVAAAYPVKIMFPMISTLDEWYKAKALLDEAFREVQENGQAIPERMETGIMVEVPATAILAEDFAEEVDFFSIGTNDLTQYTLAVDRTNERVANLASPFNPAVIRLIAITIEGAHKKKRWVGLCGEMAGNPLATPLLLGLGLDEFSMAPISIPKIKHIIRNLKKEKCEQIVQEVLKKYKTEDIVSYLADVQV
jgi:phosphoenolpyruvate-protein phosphotransferase/dihydroxyacetone kinase phosphotransfer subunit